MKDKLKANSDKLKTLPLIFVIGYLPLLLHIHFYDSGIDDYDWGLVEDMGEADLFLWIKMTAMMTVGIIMPALLIFQAVKKELRFDRAQKLAIAAVSVY